MQKLVIFDLDGTLYQTHITSVIATQQLLKDLKLPEMSAEKIISLFGEPTDVYCRKIAPTADTATWKKLEQLITAYERMHILQSGRLFDDTEKMLQELAAQGYTLAIVSNGSEEYIECVLRTCNIYGLFSFIRGRTPGLSKTDNVSALLEETKAEWAAVVGDRIHDIEAAQANKIVSIGVSHGYGKEEIKAADYVAGNALEILHHINRFSIFHELEKKLSSRDPHRAFVMGINGVDTSGKTQFSAALENYLKARGYKTQLIHLDDFHNPSSIRGRGEDPITAYIDHAFNLQMLQEELLAPIFNGCEFNKKLRLLDLETDTYDNEKHFEVAKDTIVILEGVLLYRDPIVQYFDYKIFLDIDFEEVLRRAADRDVPKYGVEFLDRYRQKYIPIQKWYLETWKPLENSHCIIDNTNYRQPQIKQIK